MVISWVRVGLNYLLSICLSTYLPIHLSVFLPCPFVFLAVYLSLYLSIALSTCIYVYIAPAFRVAEMKPKARGFEDVHGAALQMHKKADHHGIFLTSYGSHIGTNIEGAYFLNTNSVCNIMAQDLEEALFKAWYINGVALHKLIMPSK